MAGSASTVYLIPTCAKQAADSKESKAVLVYMHLCEPELFFCGNYSAMWPVWLNSYFCSENFKIGLDIPRNLVYYISSTQIHWKKEDIMEYNPALPIYLQVMTAIKHDIVAGRLALGEKMPSVRDLAIQYTINPNTAVRFV